MRNKYGYVVLLVLLVLSGCRSSKQTSTTTGGGVLTQEQAWKQVEEQAFQCRTLSARLNVNLQLPSKEMSSRVELKLVKDSAMQLSIQPFLGIELFRMELTTDSIKVLDRVNKRYLAENYAHLQGETPIEFNFFNLQALFIDHLFLPGHQSLTPSLRRRFSWETVGQQGVWQAKDAMGLRYRFTVDREGKLISTQVEEGSGQQGLSWLYADFRTVQQQIFPHRMTCELFSKGTSQGKIQMDYTRIQQDTPLNMSFSIPAKYTRVTFAQIIQAISNPQ